MTHARLFEPVQLGPVEVPNRLVAAFTGVAWGAGNLPSPLAHLAVAERAADGAGLIVGEPQSVHTSGTGSGGVVENTGDQVIGPCTAMAAAAHAGGARIVGRLWHPGILGNPGFRSVPLWGPSPVRATLGGAFPMGGGDIPHEMTTAEIDELVAAFGAAAGRLRSAGYDGVEVDAAHGSLLAQFLHPSTNRRTDSYGGTAEGRLRFLVRVLEAVRAAAGDGLVLGVRLSPDGFVTAPAGDTGMLEAALAATAAGAGYLSLGPAATPGRSAEEGTFAREAGEVGAATGLPVIYRGKVTSAATAAAIVDAGHAALVSVFQASLADSRFVTKSRAGADGEVRPCISCNETCDGSSGDPVPHCIFHALPALQGLATIQPARTPREVMVVGAGVAGMEASILLQECGHAVTLVERENDLGGQLRAAATLPGGAAFGSLATFYRNRLEALGVTVRTGTDMDAAAIAAAKPDLVIIATGSRPKRVAPGVHDTESGIALNGDAGKRVVVAIGATEQGRHSIPLAEALLQRDHEVALVFPTPALPTQAGHNGQLETYRRLLSLGAELYPDSEFVEYRDGQAAVRDVFSERVSAIGCDTVVFANGNTADDALFLEVERNGQAVYQVGDCVAPRDISSAIRDVQMLVVKLAQQEEWTS